MKKNIKIILIGITLFIISYGYYFLNVKYSFSIPCIFHAITGLYCPGCGITRMFFSLIKFDVYQAFRYNPLVFILLICSGIYFIIKMLLKKIKEYDLKVDQRIIYSILIIVLIYGILRNVPLFDFLAPLK